MTTPIKVAVVEDNDGLRESLKLLLHDSEGFQCSGAYATGEDALHAVPAQRPDVVLMDLHLPHMTGTQCITELKARMPQMQIVVLTFDDDDEQVFKALEAGASGYLIKRKSLGKVLEAVREVHDGGSPMSSQIARRVLQVFHERGRAKKKLECLTAREEEILRGLATCLSRAELAKELGISVRTIGSHIRNIYEKLHVHNLCQALNLLRPPI